MIKFNKPENLNGAELREELRTAGVTITDDINAVSLDSNGDFWLDIEENDFNIAKTIVDAHNGTIIPPEPTTTEKLAAAGLTVDELKTILGL